MTTRIVFMGSPEFAIPTLRSLVDRYNVVGVVTQPDRPAGRGRTLTPPPVKKLAGELNLPVIQPRKLSEPDAFQQLQEWEPELIVVAAFGQILRSSVLELPKHGCINVHASLLPRWRGAAPIQAAILNDDEETGITIMCMDAGVDTGAILKQKSAPISPKDTASTLSARLALLGADLLMETLPDYLDGRLTPTAQDESRATYAPMIKKEDGHLDFSAPAVDLERKIRAFNPWPGAFTTLNSQMLKIHLAHAEGQISGAPGARMIYDGLPAVSTTKGILVLDELQLAGRKPQSGKLFLQGMKSWKTDRN
jgi:methionyl-tRNA formyltransferase